MQLREEHATPPCVMAHVLSMASSTCCSPVGRNAGHVKQQSCISGRCIQMSWSFELAHLVEYDGPECVLS